MCGAPSEGIGSGIAFCSQSVKDQGEAVPGGSARSRDSHEFFDMGIRKTNRVFHTKFAVEYYSCSGAQSGSPAVIRRSAGQPQDSEVAYQADQDNEWDRNAQQQQDNGTHSNLLSETAEFGVYLASGPVKLCPDAIALPASQ